LHFLIFDGNNNLKDSKNDNENCLESTNIDYVKCNFSINKIFLNFENPCLDLLADNLIKLDKNMEYLIQRYCERLKKENKIIIPENNTKDINKQNFNIINNNDDENKSANISINETEEIIIQNFKNFLKKRSSESFEKKTPDEEDYDEDSFANLEKYFIAILENGILHYVRNEIKEAITEFNVGKNLLEQIIFIRLIYENNKFSNELFFDKEKFLKILNIVDMDNEINICQDENKISNKNYENNNINDVYLYDLNDNEFKMKNENAFLFTFLGGFYKNFNENIIVTNKTLIKNLLNEENKKLDDCNKNIVEKKNQYKSKIHFSKNLKNLISLYKDILNMITDCANKKL